MARCMTGSRQQSHGSIPENILAAIKRMKGAGIKHHSIPLRNRSKRRLIKHRYETEHLHASRIPFGLGYADTGVWQIAQAADVVFVQMGQDDGSHVIALKAKSLQLLRQGFTWFLSVLVVIEYKAHQAAIILAMPVCLFRANSGIDQNQTFCWMFQKIGMDRHPDVV